MSRNSLISDSEVIRAHTINGYAANLTPNGNNSIRYDVVSLQKNADTTYIFDRDIDWEFHNSKPLIKKSSNDKVAILKNIKIKHRHRKAGLGKELHAKNLEVLKANNFKQIQLTAKWDGVIFWPSLFFSFNDEEDENELLEAISLYMLEVLQLKKDTVRNIMKNYTDINSIKDRLKPKTKQWFTDWYKTDTECSLRFDMYKDIQ